MLDFHLTHIRILNLHPKTMELWVPITLLVFNNAFVVLLSCAIYPWELHKNSFLTEGIFSALLLLPLVLFENPVWPPCHHQVRQGLIITWIVAWPPVDSWDVDRIQLEPSWSLVSQHQLHCYCGGHNPLDICEVAVPVDLSYEELSGQALSVITVNILVAVIHPLDCKWYLEYHIVEIYSLLKYTTNLSHVWGHVPPSGTYSIKLIQIMKSCSSSSLIWYRGPLWY